MGTIENKERLETDQLFAFIRENIIGNKATFQTPFGEKQIVYADWTASGRLYKPIEEHLLHHIGVFTANTHTETSVTGQTMTRAYRKALHIIKNHVGAEKEDIILSTHSGMTGVVNKLQRILGLKVHERYLDRVEIKDEERPIVFITHMEHHSNQTSWLETIADVRIIPPNSEGLVDLDAFQNVLKEVPEGKTCIAAVTSCSNVTGIFTPYHKIAELVHQKGGYCFVDFAASAPYIDINMHPKNPAQKLDAIFFSPHKFLGGPGGTGIVIFDSRLYKNRIPDNPGGGTVDWTNPWGLHKYHDDIEAREDGGTPAFLQTIKVALAIRLKEFMGVETILSREKKQLQIIWEVLDRIDGLHVLADQQRKRLTIVSFYVEGLHYNLCAKLLNDRFGVQVRGGCSCAGTYGHYLLEVSPDISNSITSRINDGDLSLKPGWVRASFHPSMSDEDVRYVVESIEKVVLHHQKWAKDYQYDSQTNEFYHRGQWHNHEVDVDAWFDADKLFQDC